MDITIIVLSIVQAVSISLGVGSSTLAILNFFHAIKDGTIDPAERGFLGITYIVLRVAMVLILTTTILLTMYGYYNVGQAYITTYIIAQLSLIAVLFINATLMTMRLMPSKYGPAIQASSWYSLGFLLALVPQGLTDFSFITFAVTYILLIAFATVVIGFVMKWQKKNA
jgi:hypothetical protein